MITLLILNQQLEKKGSLTCEKSFIVPVALPGCWFLSNSTLRSSGIDGRRLSQWVISSFHYILIASSSSSIRHTDRRSATLSLHNAFKDRPPVYCVNWVAALSAPAEAPFGFSLYSSCSTETADTFHAWHIKKPFHVVFWRIFNTFWLLTFPLYRLPQMLQKLSLLTAGCISLSSHWAYYCSGH